MRLDYEQLTANSMSRSSTPIATCVSGNSGSHSSLLDFDEGKMFATTIPINPRQNEVPIGTDVTTSAREIASTLQRTSSLSFSREFPTRTTGTNVTPQSLSASSPNGSRGVASSVQTFPTSTGTTSTVQLVQNLAPSTTPSEPHSGSEKSIIIGLAVPLAVVAVVLGVLLWVKTTRKAMGSATQSDTKRILSNEPYFPTKEELEVEECARYELNTDPSIPELVDTQMHEVEGADTAGVLQGRELFELRDETRTLEVLDSENTDDRLKGRKMNELREKANPTMREGSGKGDDRPSGSMTCRPARRAKSPGDADE